MTYEAAQQKAWAELEKLSDSQKYNVSLFSDSYELNVKDRRIFSDSCNVPAKEYIALLLLHYLIGTLENKYVPCGQWISFKEIKGGETYYPAYRKGVIEPLLRKYGRSPESLFDCLERFQGNKIDGSDIGIEITTFADVRVRVILWKADEEFGPEASILFDKNLTKLYTMEDITVFSHCIVNNL